MSALALVVSAIACSSASAAYVVATDPFDSGDTTETVGGVDCPGDALAMGGGVKTSNDFAEAMFVESSSYSVTGTDLPTGQWEVRVANFPGGSPTLTGAAYAICNDSADAGDYEVVHSSAVADDDGRGSATVGCGTFDGLVGGGVSHDGGFDDNAHVASSGLNENRKWQAVVDNRDDFADELVNIDVFAVCEVDGGDNYTYPTNTEKVKDGKLETSTAKCKHGRKLVGGGVITNAAQLHGLFVASTAPKGDNWRGSVANTDTPDGKTRKITTTVICRR